jgi:hypothetical protein
MPRLAGDPHASLPAAPLSILTPVLQRAVSLDQRHHHRLPHICRHGRVATSHVCPATCRLHALYTARPSLRDDVNSVGVGINYDSRRTHNCQCHCEGQLRQPESTEHLQQCHQHGQCYCSHVPAACPSHASIQFLERVHTFRSEAPTNRQTPQRAICDCKVCMNDLPLQDRRSAAAARLACSLPTPTSSNEMQRQTFTRVGSSMPPSPATTKLCPLSQLLGACLRPFITVIQLHSHLPPRCGPVQHLGWISALPVETPRARCWQQ